MTQGQTKVKILASWQGSQAYSASIKANVKAWFSDVIDIAEDSESW